MPHSLVVFTSPEDFLTALQAGQIRWSNIELLLTDLYFQDSSIYTGLTFTSKIRKNGFLGPIFLVTEAAITTKEREELLTSGPTISAILPKDPESAFSLLRTAILDQSG